MLLKTDLLAALRRLDVLLGLAVQSAPSVYGVDALRDPYRGLYVDWDAVQRLLSQEPGAPLFPPVDHVAQLVAADEMPTFQRLAHAFDLSPFDLDVLLLALTPEIDLRYCRLYAYLQDDVSRKYPTVDLALNLLCATPDMRLLRRSHFAPDAPLIRHGLLHLDHTSDKTATALLGRSLRVDEQIIRLLLDQPGIDSRLAAFCQWVTPAETLADLPLMDMTRQRLRNVVARDAVGALYFGGPQDAIKRQAAAALAAECGASLLLVDVARLLAETRDFAQSVRLVLREGWLTDSFVYFDDVDPLTAADAGLSRRLLLDALESNPLPVILAGSLPCPADGVLLPVDFPTPDFQTRRAIWQAELARAGVAIRPEVIEALAGHYYLLAGQIAQAVTLAARQAASASPESAALFWAARAQFSDSLGELAHKIKPVHAWDDIILPDDALSQLRELCARFVHRQRVMDDWGFDSKLSRGKGIAALFAGPSGTGKTMAAEIIAGGLNLDLYRIDLSQIVSKYIGETEKNLSRVFEAAAQGNAILFFDEADALFGKRTEVRDSHDRYANIEISYLLQQMETYEGISILATNLRQNIDPAFLRRLAFAVHFPFPDERSRLLIWQGIWPERLPLAADVDLAYMAGQFRLSGGNIKNVALAAAFLAAETGEPVRMAHLLHATRRELEKSGKMLSESELNGFGHQPAGSLTAQGDA